MTGIIILGHGSRSEEANAALLAIAEMVQEQMNQATVEAAFLQFSRPDLREAVAKMVGQGLKKVVVVPLFLFRGIHLQEDIPGELDELRKEYAGQIELIFAGHLGTDPRIAEIVMDRIREVS